MVGAALAQTGLARSALRLYIWASVGVGAVAISHSLTNSFRPAYPLSLHKNAAGWLLCVALIVVVKASRDLRIGRTLATICGLTIGLGLLASQARGATLAFVLVAGIGFLRRSRTLRARVGVAAAALVMLAAIGAITSNELKNENTVQFGGISSRLDTNSEALELWRGRAWFGAGLSYYQQGARNVGPEPHNFVVEALAESGAVGALGFAVFLAQAARVVRRFGGEFGSLARTVFYARLVEALFGIFWVAGMGAISWIVVGIAAAMMRSADEERDDATLVGAHQSNGVGNTGLSGERMA